MPLVKIYLRDGRPPEDLRQIGDAIHGALVTLAGVPPDDRFQIVHQLDSQALAAHATYGGVQRTEGLVLVEIILNAGRTVETKRNLYAGITERLECSPGIRPDDVLIVLVEVSKENWSFGGGRATYA
jgi:phenylpyruvate tautomerase PptA (4-oxalocrotonate tautomerase family)